MGLTDGTFICGLCGEAMTGCALCGTAPLIDMRKQLEQERRDERDAEQELWRQEQSIRRGAEKRRGEW